MLKPDDAEGFVMCLWQCLGIRMCACSWFYYRRPHNQLMMTCSCVLDCRTKIYIFFLRKENYILLEIGGQSYIRWFWSQNYCVWCLWKDHVISFQTGTIWTLKLAQTKFIIFSCGSVPRNVISFYEFHTLLDKLFKTKGPEILIEYCFLWSVQACQLSLKSVWKLYSSVMILNGMPLSSQAKLTALG